MPCWGKPQWCKTPMATTSAFTGWGLVGVADGVEGLRRWLHAFSCLPGGTYSHTASPSQVEAVQLRFLHFPPSILRPGWRQSLLGFFSARGLNLLSPSWEHSVTAAFAAWPGCHCSWCPFYCQIRGHCRDVHEAFQIRRCTSSSRFQIQQRGFCIQPTGSEFISPMQTALHCLPVN